MSTPDPRSASRDPFLDNAKYLTILLVGIGHAWAPLRDDSRTVAALYLLVYAFHMPAFSIISGYLSRSFTGRPAQIQRLVTTIVVPYLVCEVAFTLFMRLLAHPGQEFSVQRPNFALWFLAALFIWRLTTPLWRRLRQPVPVALAIGLLASVTPSVGDDYNMMRVLQFLPFFVLGLHLRPQHLERVKQYRLRAPSAAVLLATAVFTYWLVPRMDPNWLLHTDSAAAFGVPAWAGGAMYLALFGCSVLLTACFLNWVPQGRHWFTALGAGTLYAYLLHTYPIKVFREFQWDDLAGMDHPLSRLAITLLAGALMTALCTAPVRAVFRFAIEPDMSWLFRQDPREEPSTASRDTEPGARQGPRTRRPAGASG
ncbi:acyltransferase family protein [Streptomyces sp. TR06-5]|uniref:acyltransferase family protein n=1 Tax=unclassified Streptomyces TaxID=2593676 RepID=UPI00399F79AE